MKSAGSCGGVRWTEKFDGVARARRRELQVVRAEGLACKSAAEALCRAMVDERAALDAAVEEYRRRAAALAAQQVEAHRRLTAVLQDRSAAETALERVRDRADNELQARRTAGTVRAYRLDARWRQLHDRYRGFVTNVLRSGGGGGGGDDEDGRRRSSPARKTSGPGRRFFAVVDKFGSQYRRESLRTSRSIHALMAGYLRETSGGGSGSGHAVRGPGPATAHRRSLATLDGVGPDRVSDKLRVMQEQCARIAERVRRRDGCAGSEGPGRRLGCGVRSDGGDDKRRQADLLSDARDRLAAGRDYVRTVRGLMDRAVTEVQRDRVELREALCKTCAACVGTRAAGPQDRSCTVVEVAGRLERACFALFARLDRAAVGDRDRDDAGRGAHDVVTLCLRTVQANRANAVRRARDVAYRVNDFRKAVDRLLLACTSTAAGGVGRRRSRVLPVRDGAAVSRTPRPALRRTRGDTTAVARPLPPPPGPSSKDMSMAESAAVVTPPTDVAAVTMLCPPSIGVVEYE